MKMKLSKKNVKKVNVAPEMQLAWAAVCYVCPAVNIKFAYNEDEKSIALEDCFYIAWCENEPQPYLVSVAVYLPGDRETPPDYDINDLKSFEKPIPAVKFAIEEYLKGIIQNQFNDFSEVKSYEQEEMFIKENRNF